MFLRCPINPQIPRTDYCVKKNLALYSELLNKTSLAKTSKTVSFSFLGPIESFIFHGNMPRVAAGITKHPITN